jgi:uncharacterized protein with LGFP repeats
VGYAVIDRSSLDVLHGDVYPDKGGADIYGQLASALAPYDGNSGVLVAILVWGATNSTSDPLGYPTPGLYDFLVSIGAGTGLALWTQPTGSSVPIGSSGGTFWISYGIVGVPGGQAGSAFEDFNSNHNPNVVPVVDLEVFLRPESEPGKIVYTPS